MKNNNIKPIFAKRLVISAIVLAITNYLVWHFIHSTVCPYGSFIQCPPGILVDLFIGSLAIASFAMMVVSGLWLLACIVVLKIFSNQALSIFLWTTTYLIVFFIFSLVFNSDEFGFIQSRQIIIQ